MLKQGGYSTALVRWCIQGWALAHMLSQPRKKQDISRCWNLALRAQWRVLAAAACPLGTVWAEGYDCVPWQLVRGVASQQQVPLEWGRSLSLTSHVTKVPCGASISHLYNVQAGRRFPKKVQKSPALWTLGTQGFLPSAETLDFFQI